MDLSRQVTDCSNWSQVLPQVIKEAKDEKIGKYLDGYKQMLEREKQLEELESQTHMSSKYRRFLSYTHLAESQQGSNGELTHRLFKPNKGKFYLTSIVKSKSDISDCENNEKEFELKNLNEDMVKSYISKLVGNPDEAMNDNKDFKKKFKAETEYHNLNIEPHTHNTIDFEKVIIKDLTPFDLSKYTLPKEKTLRENAIKKIYNEQLIEIDTKLYSLSNREDEDKANKILLEKKESDIREPFNEISAELDAEFDAIENISNDLIKNNDDVVNADLAVKSDPFKMDTTPLQSLEQYNNYLNIEAERLDTFQSELSKLKR